MVARSVPAQLNEGTLSIRFDGQWHARSECAASCWDIMRGAQISRHRRYREQQQQ